MLVEGKPYYPDVVNALRSTLRHLEELKVVPEDDPILMDLKRSILIKLAEIEEPRNTDMAAD
jgi:hypothetical protein